MAALNRPAAILLCLSAAWMLHAADTTAPTPPGVPVLVRAAHDRLALSWAPATDESQALRYEVRRAGTAVGWSTTPSYIATGLAASSSAAWTVVAVDAAGNRSAVSPALTAGTLAAATVPTVTLTTPTAIAPGDTTHQGKILVVNNTTLTISGSHVFYDLILTGSAVLTHPDATTTTEPRCDLTVLRDVTIASTARIDLTGRGYRSGNTLGNIVSHQASISYRSGSHGGYGRRGTGTQIEVYGDMFQPDHLGAGGGQTGGTGHGGGRLRLRAGKVQLDGQILANGSSNTTTGSGAGGSVLIDAGELVVAAGAGRIQANGGSYAGGGRIACYFRTGAVTGSQCQAQSTSSGGAGSIVVQDHDVAMPTLRWDNGASAPYADVANTPCWFGTRGSPTTAPAEFRADVQLSGQARVLLESPTRLVLGAAAIWTASSQLSAPAGITTTAGLTLDNATLTVPILTGSALTLTNGAKLHSFETTDTAVQSLQVELTGALTVGTGCFIDVNGRGYIGGRGAGNVSHAATQNYRSGSYGGHGRTGGGALIPVYGDPLSPAEPGSGGGQSGGGDGGGLVRLTADALILNGTIQANGTYVGYWGGSGGGVFIDVRDCTMGTASVIEADGGSYAGGGRIALFHRVGTVLNSKITARGGSSGGCGSIVIRDRDLSYDVWRFYNSSTQSAEAPATPWWFGTRGQPATAPGEVTAQIELGGQANVTSESLTTVRMPLTATWTDAGTRLTLPALAADAGLTLHAASLVVGQLSGSALTVKSGSRVQSYETTATQVQSLTVTMTGAVTIDAGAFLDVNGRGYIGGRGAGNVSHAATQNYRSGSYGGHGRTGGGALIPVYGDPLSPAEPGSGGGQSGGGDGGGLVRLTADALILNGTIQANGTYVGYWGGSGGGIFIDVRDCTMGTAGVIEADGGSYAGGGRIALFHRVGTVLNSKITARSGSSGGCGSIVIRDRDLSYDVWRFYNSSTQSSEAPATPWWFGNRATPGSAPAETVAMLELGTYAQVNLETPTRLRLPLAAVWTTVGTSLTLPKGLTADAALAVQGPTVTIGTTGNSALTAVGEVSIVQGTMQVDQVTAPTLVLRTSARLSSLESTATDVHGLTVTVAGAVTLDAGTYIDANGRGYIGSGAAGHRWRQVERSAHCSDRTDVFAHRGDGPTPGAAGRLHRCYRVWLSGREFDGIRKHH